MTDRDQLGATLDSLVPPFDDGPGDWADVMRRAEAVSEEPPTRAEVRRRNALQRLARRPRLQRSVLRPVLTVGAVLALAGMLATPPGRAASAWVGDLVGIGEVGGPPTRQDRPSHGGQGKPFVIATGHAPDGARYELVLDRFPNGIKIADGEPADSCVQLEWPELPRAGVTSGFCGPGFPPSQNRGRAPGGAAARPFGFLTPYEEPTRYLVLMGFAEPHVARARVVYRTKSSGQLNAAVDFFDLPTDVHRRIGSIKPVDVFVAFLPRSAAAFDPSRESNSLHILAYDRRGRIVGSVRHTNLANPISRPIRRRGP